MSVYVNQVEISEDEIAREMQYHPAPSQEQAWRLAAHSLVVRQLLLQQAANNALFDQAENLEGQKEADVIDQLLQHDVTVPEADEATCKRFYNGRPTSFVNKETGKRLSFTEAQPFIQEYLHTKAMRMAVAEYIKALTYQADIKGIELVGSDIALPEY